MSIFFIRCCLFFFFIILIPSFFLFFFFNDTATTEIYTLSLHDALPICFPTCGAHACCQNSNGGGLTRTVRPQQTKKLARSEEHTSELQSRSDLVCRLLLEKKKKTN